MANGTMMSVTARSTQMITDRGLSFPPHEIENSFIIVGIVMGESEKAYTPFWVASKIGQASDAQPPYTEGLSATLSDNRTLTQFKETAWRTFLPMSLLTGNRPYTMIVHDRMFYDLIETIRQNIYIIDVITPIIFYLSIFAAVVASFLVNRRRKTEYALMRGMGIKKTHMFFSIMMEQTVLGATGAAMGCLVFYLSWGYLFVRGPAILLACYVFGAILSTFKAVGADVLKIMRERYNE